MHWSRNYYHCSYCNTDSKVAAYETDLVLCDVRRNYNEDTGDGNSEDCEYSLTSIRKTPPAGTVIANLYLSNLLLIPVVVSGIIYIIFNLFFIQYKREKLCQIKL